MRCVVALAMALLLFGAPAAASSQSIGSLELVAQSAWVDDGGIYDLQVRVAGANPESYVVLRVYPPWPERDDFLRQELPEDVTPVLELEPVVLGEVQGTSNEVLGFEIAIAGPDTTFDDTTEFPIDVLSTDGGSAVHPVEVSLYNADNEVIDQFLTSLIELPRGQRTAPLRTSLVLEAHLPPASKPNVHTELDEESLDNLETIVSAVVQHPSANVALSISPASLVELNRSTNERALPILDNIREHFTSNQLLPNPYAEVQEQAWVDAGLKDELLELYATGSDTTAEIVGKRPDNSVMLLDRTIDTSGLRALTETAAPFGPDSTDENDPASGAVQAVIVRPAQLPPLDADTFPQALTTRFVIPTGDGDSIPALVADGALANHFTNAGGAAYNANRLLADLTLLSLQNSDVRQAVVINPPVDWVPDASFLNVLLSGLERIPALEAASPIEALADTTFTPIRGIGTLSPPLERDLNPRRQPDDLRSFRTEFSQAGTAIASWSAVIAADQASANQLETLLHSSTDYRLTNAERSSHIDAIYALIDEQKDGSITTPVSDTITLTGRTSNVPITVENNLTVAANVLLLLDSEKLSFPEGQVIEAALVPGSNRIDVPIEARASGDSPIRIQVFSPDRSVLLGSSEVLVRTFAFSGVGIVIGVAAIVVLLLWWLRHVRSSRDTVPTDVATDSTSVNG